MANHLSRLLQAIPRPWTPATFGYVLRSITAAGLALWLGFYLNLESPFSGASTVLLLVHPIQGAVVGKGLNRVIGTLVGMIAAFVLTALFAQQMLLYILGIGLWLGLCVGAMTLLRHYQATAAVVAGYTVCLALGPALVAPDKAFDHIITRGTAVVLGVFSLSLIATLFSRKTSEQKVRHALSVVCSRSAQLLAAQCSGKQSSQMAADQRQLAIDIGKVDELLGVAKGESSLIRTRMLTIQVGLAQLQAAILHGPLAEPEADIQHALADVSQELQRLGEGLANATCGFAAAADQAGHIRIGPAPETCTSLTPGSMSSVERLEDQLADFAGALESFSSLDRQAHPPERSIGFHRHYPDALRNGIRALCATLVTGGLWYLTAWDQGPTLLAVLGPSCTLLAAAAAPIHGHSGFIRGTLYAVLTAAVYKFLLMPQINGFPLLFITLAMFWSLGIHATTQPRQALQGVAYLIAFNTLVSTGGTAQYDFTDFANQALAWIAAMLISLLAFHILPKDAGKQVLALKKALHRETLVLLRHGQRVDHDQWQAKQQHRMVSLHNLLGPEPQHDDQAGYLSLQLGRELKRLQRKASALDPSSPIARCAQAGRLRIARNAHAPSISAAQARRTSKTMTRLGAPHWAACYQDLAWLLQRYANTTHCPLAGHRRTKDIGGDA
ncbi:FUSC family protein [Pseudomonas vanderleydeniana]|uniref:FUSC family protein n=1 Tax=Pseudomonas vanderleydeniana TaxID=2745495 RepID=A0A9E6TTX2_9PSED|nr:FUSC family protein [Pseudomonas vanderleydeniana]QXI31138.1 FUSC family protein [Pseudomonas vanderleydeniana]